MFEIKLNTVRICYHTNYVTVVSSLEFDIYNSAKKYGLLFILSKNSTIFSKRFTLFQVTAFKCFHIFKYFFISVENLWGSTQLRYWKIIKQKKEIDWHSKKQNLTDLYRGISAIIEFHQFIKPFFLGFFVCFFSPRTTLELHSWLGWPPSRT